MGDEVWGPKSGPEKKPRKSKKKWVTITQFNGNAWQGSKDLIEAEACVVDAVCVQEHKKLEPELLEMRASLQKGGWDASAAAAVDTGDAQDNRFRSAGVCVAVRREVGSQMLWPYNRADFSPAESPGRLAGRWCNMCGGLALFSLYMFDGEGWSDRNRALIKHLGGIVRNIDCLWVVSLDANMEPEEFAENPEVNLLKAVLVAPKGGTCRFKEKWRKLDFFLMDKRMQVLWPEARVVDEWPSYPHKPVRLTFKRKGEGLHRMALVAPQPLPIGLPVGCARPPPDYPDIGETEASEEQLTKDYGEFIAKFEGEILDTWDVWARRKEANSQGERRSQGL